MFKGDIWHGGVFFEGGEGGGNCMSGGNCLGGVYILEQR